MGKPTSLAPPRAGEGEGEGSHWSDSAVLPNDPEVLARVMTACEAYLIRAAEDEMHPACRSKGEPEDLVQDTYLETYRRLPEFVGRTFGDFRRFMARALRNNVVNFTRDHVFAKKRTTRREVPMAGEGSRPGPEDLLTASSPSPSGVLMKGETVEIVRKAMATLDEEERLLIELCDREGLSWQEIGARLGVSAEAARKRHPRAWAKLQVAVQAIQGDESVVI